MRCSPCVSSFDGAVGSVLEPIAVDSHERGESYLEAEHQAALFTGSHQLVILVADVALHGGMPFIAGSGQLHALQSSGCFVECQAQDVPHFPAVAHVLLYNFGVLAPGR